MTQQEALFNYLLRLGDNALILSYRLGEWSSNAPYLEEDLALTNIALDLTGRADALLRYAGQIEGKGRTEDDLAFKRDERHFYNNLITELPNGDFAATIARQLLYSTFDLLLYEALTKSSDATIAGIAEKAIKETKYHIRHCTQWMYRLGDGTEESHKRTQTALDELWMFTGELFEMDEVDNVLIKDGIAVDLQSLRSRWNERVSETIVTSTLTRPTDGYMQSGSRKGVHSEYLGFILSEMQYLPRAYPDAKW
ncbi:MAG TPA: 1,2-phenylacetyl-CoA epoxidase subunit PaaC [Candidatus Kapabacteria bacterium]